MINYEYQVIDSDKDEHSLVALSFNVIDGLVVFYGGENERLVHTFYHPINVLCLGEYKEKAND